MSRPPEQLTFRRFSSADARALTSWARSPDELLQWSGPLFSYPLDEPQLIEYASAADERCRPFSAITSDTGVVAGHAELNILPEHELCQIRRVAVAPALRGQGIATRLLRWLVAYAFDELHLHRVELAVFSFNEPALRCYERVGFEVEGTARDARRASDGYWDLVYMALLANRYRREKVIVAPMQTSLLSAESTHL